MTLRARILPIALASVVVVPAGGCELFNALLSQEFQIPLDLETPPAELNATDQVDALEASLCDDADSYNCAVVSALDLTDDEQVSDPPRIPAEFPISVEITNPETGDPETVDVEVWAEEVGLGQDLDLKQIIPMDLTALVAIDDPAAIEEVTVADVALGWIDNTFTFDTLPMDLYIGTELVDDPTVEPEQLIADGVVQKVGTIPAQEAETSGDAPVSFVDGGNEIFNNALKGLKFTAIVAMPPETTLALKEGSAENLRRKPTGAAEVSLKATVMYTVSAAKLQEGATDVVDEANATE